MSVEPASRVAPGWAARAATGDQFVQRARRQEMAAVGAVGGHGLALQGCQGRRQRRTVERDARQFAHAHGGIDDRAVAGAAAQIARQGIVDLAAAGPCAILLEIHAPQGHDETGRAKAALGTVALDHGLLHRVQGAIVLLQVLHRKQGLAVERGNELDAGIDRVHPDLAILERADHDRAGAAIAFGAAFLGAGAVQVVAQVLQNGLSRRGIAHFAHAALIVETDRC